MGPLFIPYVLLFATVLLILIGAMLVALVPGLNKWSFNNQQPVLTVQARIVTKRLRVSGGGHNGSASTRYYITFESMADGLRQEFSVPSAEYSGLADGDTGDLTHPGTRYKGFIRVRQPVTPPPAPPVPPASNRTCGYCSGLVPDGESKCPSCGASTYTAKVVAS